MFTIDVIAALLILAAVALLAGAILRWRRTGDSHGRRHAILMTLAALVALANVAILLWPAPPGDQRIGESGASRMSR